jgi:hypothetical protein
MSEMKFHPIPNAASEDTMRFPLPNIVFGRRKTWELAIELLGNSLLLGMYVYV